MKVHIEVDVSIHEISNKLIETTYTIRILTKIALHMHIQRKNIKSSYAV